MRKKVVYAEIDKQLLARSWREDIPYFNYSEAQFLSPHAPVSFDELDPSLWSNNIYALAEINQTIFDVIVKLDNSIARGRSPKGLFAEKTAVLKPFMEAYEISPIPEGDIITRLHTLKMIGLDLMAYTSVGSAAIARIRTPEPRFEEAREHIMQVFGDVPIFVFGSALTKADPSDIDTTVSPQELTLEHHLALMRNRMYELPLPISTVVIPERYMQAYGLSDPHQTMSQEKSVVINGSPVAYTAPAERVRAMQFANAAIRYIRLRECLTPEGFEATKVSPARINNLLKVPKFVHEDLEIECVAPVIRKVETIPRDAILYNLLAEATITAYQLLRKYQDMAR